METKEVITIYYVIGDGNGNFIRRDFTGKYTVSSCESLAEHWSDQCKATNVLNNAIHRQIRKRYKVLAIEEPTFDSEEEIQEVRLEREPIEIDDSQLDAYFNSIQAAGAMLEDIEAKIAFYRQELSEVDKEISDITHFIEMKNLDLYRAWKTVMLLKQALRKRRKIKDKILILSTLNKDKEVCIKIKEMKKMLDGLENRQYAPRVLTNLF